MKFQTRIELGGKTATGLEVPAETVEALGGGKKPLVYVTIGTHTYRSTVAVMGGRYMIPLSADNRQAAGVAAGDEVEVELRLDTDSREVKAPDDLAAALAEAPEARAFFEGLSNSNKGRIVLSVEGAKTEETRRKRIDKAVQALSEGKVV